MTLPAKIYLSQGEILAANVGIQKRHLLAAVASGELKRKVFAGMTRGKYRRDEVMRVFGIKEAGCV